MFRTPRFFPGRTLFAALLGVAVGAPSFAQTTYTYTGTGDNSNASRWNVVTNWDAGLSPGSQLNGSGGTVLDDAVILRNNRGNGSQQRVRLQVDAGTVASLEIGGFTVAGSTGNTQLQMRGGSVLAVTGDLTLGSTVGGGQRGGQINFANGAPVMSVGGNIVSGSTSGANNININSGGTFTLTGDIDSAAARGGASDQEIDFIISRNEGLVLNGAGAQELNLESFYIISTGANVGTITQTIGASKTVNALDGRIGSVNNNNWTANGTLAVDGGTINYTNNLVLGRTQNRSGTSNDTANATGNLNVGGTTAGNVTVGGLLILGQQLGTQAGNAQVSNGNVTVSNAGSVLNLNGGVNMGATVQTGGTTSASITINDGQVNLTGAITEDAAQAGNSSISVLGGELALLDAAGGTRSVDTLTHSGGIIDFTVYGGMPTLATTDTTLAVAPGGSVIDITTAPGGTTVSTTDQNTWTGGGTGATPDGVWDSEGADWSATTTPDGSFGAIGAGDSFVLVSSTNAITGDAGAAVLTGGASGAGWSVAQNSNDITVTAGSAVAGGVGVAHFNDGAADVTRTSAANIEAAAGTGADASQIDIDDVNTLQFDSDLILGGTAAGGVVNQGNVGGGSSGAMAVTVQGSLVLDGGAVYNLNEGTLAVSGGVNLVAPADNGQLIINSSTANSFTSTGGVTVDRLSVGDAPGSNSSIAVTYDLNARQVDIGTNGDAQGSLTIQSGGSLTTTARVYVAGNQTGNQDQNTVGNLTLETGGVLNVSGGNLEVGRDGAGTFTVNGGTYTQFTNNLVLGQNGTNPDDAANGDLIVNGGILDIGEITNAATPNLNINAGGGSVTLNNGAINIENALNMVDQNNQSGSVTVNGGTLTVGGNLNYRGGSGADTVTIAGGTTDVTGSVLMNTSSTNFLVIDGSAGSLAIGNDLNVGASATVQFNLDAGGAQTISVDDQLLLNGGSGNISFDFTDFITAGNTADNFGDVDLIEALGLGDGGAQTTGIQSWSTAYGTQVSPTFSDGSWYELQERDGSLIVYLQSIPEPSSVLLVTLGSLLFLRRRR